MSVTVARDVTERLNPPRAVFVPFRMGHHFGVPFHRVLQRRVILEAFKHLTEARSSGEIHDIPVTWAQARRDAALLTKQNGKDRNA